MSSLEIDSKKLELLKRSNELLEKTKKEYKKYEVERKTLLRLTTNNSVEYDEWERILDSIESLISLNEDKSEK